MTLLEVQHLTVGYTVPVVRDISFQLESGRLVGLLGRNGSGKTTLLRGLTGAARVFGGTASAAGQDCLHTKPRQRAKQLAFLPQRTQLLQGMQVGEVICMGRYVHSGPFAGPGPGDEQAAREAAEQLGIADLWGRDCSALSEGQRQLVHLARVAAQDAPVLLLDEPSSALDVCNSSQLFRQVRQMTAGQNKAALVVLHDPALALRWCDVLLRMDGGTLTGSLNPREASCAQAQSFLAQLYPGIRVKRDAETGCFYCLME